MTTVSPDLSEAKIVNAISAYLESVSNRKAAFSDTIVRYLTGFKSGNRRSLNVLNSILDCIEVHKGGPRLLLRLLGALETVSAWQDFRTSCNQNWKSWRKEGSSAPISANSQTLQVFVSYGESEAAWAEDVVSELVRHQCKVTSCVQSKSGEGHNLEELRKSIEGADCLIVLISSGLLRGQHPWVSRQVALAKRLQSHRQRGSAENRYPLVFGIFHPEIRDVGVAQSVLELHGFESGAKEPGHHDFEKYGKVMFDQRDPSSFVRELLRFFTYEITHIKCAADLEAHDEIFDGAMAIYEDLIPLERERDPEDFIRKWIGDNSERPSDQKGGDRANWLDWLSVVHHRNKAHGAFWCNVDLRSGIGNVPFWGMESGFRSDGLAARLVADALKEIQNRLGDSVQLKALAFDVEPVELSVFSAIVERAYKRYCADAGGPQEAAAEQYKLKEVRKKIDGLSTKSYLQTEVEAFVSSRQNAEEFVDQLRRFRRLALYCSFMAHSNELQRAGWEVRAFVKSADNLPETNSTFSAYWQPPIIAGPNGGNVRDEDSCEFYLFCIVKPGTDLKAADIIEWEYDHFLADQYSAGKQTFLKGWDDYMVPFEKRHIPAFTKGAKLKVPCLGPSYDSAKAILRLVNSFQKSALPTFSILSRLDITL